jgi:leucine dehydrogenase
LAAELSAQTALPEEILTAGVDVVAPCAVGGVITPEVAERLRAWAVCGAANNILGGPTTAAAAEAERVLAERGILWVPDVISSAGAVIDGIGESVMGLDDRMPLVDGLGETARAVLDESLRTGRRPSQLAEEQARRRIERAANRRARG